MLDILLGKGAGTIMEYQVHQELPVQMSTN